MPKKNIQAGRPDKRAKKRVMVRPAPATEQQGELAPDRPAAAALPARSAWTAPARSSGRSSGLIKDEDYRYIYGDLRRIGIVAGGLFAVLVVLTFVLR